jgi:hypothetical protein
MVFPPGRCEHQISIEIGMKKNNSGSSDSTLSEEQFHFNKPGAGRSPLHATGA